ncbi:MAG: glycosyltransferase [Alphaproteobacteria bacterium]|nr:glycosyltransferase [Alphaproteobacteria bacterium]
MGGKNLGLFSQTGRGAAEVDRVSTDLVAGWACFHDNSERVVVEVLVDGVVVASTVANNFRPDLKQLGISDGYSGFQLEFPARCFDGASHVVILREASTQALLTREPVALEFAQKPVDAGLIGLFEHVDRRGTVSGWAMKRSAPDVPVTVDVLVDGVAVVSRPTDIIRPDLISAGISKGRSGFNISIPSSAFSSLMHEVSIAIDGQPLGGGSKTLDWSSDATLLIARGRGGELLVELRGWPGTSAVAELLVNGVSIDSVVLQKDEDDRVSGVWSSRNDLLKNRINACQAVFRDGSGIVLRSDVILWHREEYAIEIESANFESISGWVVKLRDERPVDLGLYDCGNLIATVTADLDRNDVQKELCLSSGRCGFKFSLPKWGGKAGKNFEIRDNELDLPIGQIWIGYRYDALTALARYAAKQDHLNAQEILAPALIQLISSSKDDVIYHFRKSSSGSIDSDQFGVDVVIPVYAGALETVECIESVLSVKNGTNHRVIIVNDSSNDPIIIKYLDSIEKNDNVLILHRNKNGGFSEAVNIGLIVSGSNDAVILNSDTVVQDNWLDRLTSAAATDDRIATVTPLSNNGEICTFPYICKSLPVQSSTIAALVDQTAAQKNKGEVRDIPVGVGFCLFVRRKAINEIGLLDAAKWGRGYGEEVDFCLKAAARGWRNVVAGDIFVVHRGGVSFGEEKKKLIFENSKEISKLYPFFDDLVHRFISTDPLRPLRRRIAYQLLDGLLPKKRFLHLVHDFGGGTEKYVNDICALIEAEGGGVAILRSGKEGDVRLSFRLAGNNLDGLFLDDHNEEYGAGDISQLLKDLEQLGFQKIFVHSPLNMNQKLFDWISGRDYDISIHDYSWTCPRVHLYVDKGVYCGEDLQNCNACVRINEPHRGARDLVRRAGFDVGLYRANLARVVASAGRVFCGANDVKERLERHGFQGNYRVIAHPLPEEAEYHPLVMRRDQAGKIRVGVFGAISDIKGFHQLVECIDLAVSGDTPIEFVVFGYTMKDSIINNKRNVQITGKYEEKDLRFLIEKHAPDVALFLNQVPETFSYTLSYCLMIGLWPIVTDIGAPAERVRAAQFGTVIPLELEAAGIIRAIVNTTTKNRAHSPIKPSISLPKSLHEYGYD